MRTRFALSGLALVCFGLLLGFATAELFCRYYYSSDFALRYFKIGDRKEPWMGIPRQNEYHNGKAEFSLCYDHRQRGHLDDDYCVQLTMVPPGVRPSLPYDPMDTGEFRIVVLGDSFTFGEGVRDNETYSSRLQQRLSQSFIGDARPVVINMGEPGADTAREEHFFREHLDETNPNLVVLQWNTNDCPLPELAQQYSRTINNEYDSLKSPPREVSWSRFLTIAWRELRRRELSRHLITLQDQQLSRVLPSFDEIENIHQLAKEHGAEFVLVIFPELFRFDHYPYEGVMKKLEEFANAHSIPVVNLFPALQQYPPEILWVHPSDLHPNPFAHQIASDTIYDYLAAHYHLQ